MENMNVFFVVKRQNNYILFSNCKHSFISCKICNIDLSNKCPICRKKGPFIDIDDKKIKDTFLCESFI